MASTPSLHDSCDSLYDSLVTAYLVLFPPMKPPAWTKVQPGILVTSSRAESLTPLQASGRLSLFSKLLGSWGTHWILHMPDWSV